MVTSSYSRVNKLSLIPLLIMLGLAAFYYTRLPETIPIHFNAKLVPDGWAGKMSIWLMPIVALVTYLVMYWSLKFSINSDPSTLRKWQTSYKGKSDEFIKRSVAYNVSQASYLNFLCQLLFLGIFIYGLAAAFDYYIPFAAWIFWAFVALTLVPAFNILKFHFTAKD